MTWLVLGIALVMEALGLAGRFERLPRNPLAGIRVPPVTDSDETWRDGHRAAAPYFIVVGVVGLGLVALASWGNLRADLADTVCAWYLGGVGVSLLIATVVAVNAVRDGRRG